MDFAALSCAGVRQPVRLALDTIPRDRACRYVREALEKLAKANPSEVVVAADDTALVSSATVNAIQQEDSTGAPIAAWWLVTLHLQNKPYDAEVRIDQGSGEQAIRPVHK
jgi:hypothetical protein